MTLQIALTLARNGYYVHPLRERDKIPLAPHGSNDATRDEDVIRTWWQRWPAANVGISLDKSGVLDIAPDCPEWAAQFEANGLPHTTRYSSGGGAGHWHSWYRRPQDAPIARSCIPNQYDIMSQGNAVAPGSVHPSGRTYEWNTPLLPVEDLPLAPAWAVALLQAKPEGQAHDDADWADLPNSAQEAHCRRFRALCAANEQLRKVCAGEAVTLIIPDTGAKDDSTSAQRSVFVNQLIRAKYLPSVIRALARHFAGVLDSGHGDRAFEADIDRLLIRYTPKNYKPEPTRGAQAPRGGRHYEITAGELLDQYHLYADCGPLGILLDWSVTDAADRLGVSCGTIKRREAELIAGGQIRRDYGRVILSPDTWNIGSQRIEMPQAVDTAPWQTGSQRSAMPQTEDEATENTIGSQFDSAHSDAVNAPEMAVCEEQARVLEITHPPVLPTPRVLRCGPWFYIADGERCGATASTEVEAWAAWGTPESAECADLQPESAEIVPDSVTSEAASFTPIELPDRPYTARSKRLMGNTERYTLIWASMRERPDDDASATQATQLDLAAVLSQGECVVSRANGPPGASSSQQQAAFL